MKIALAQINPTVGDLAGNRRLVGRAAEAAGAAGAYVQMRRQALSALPGVAVAVAVAHLSTGLNLPLSRSTRQR